MLRASCLFAFTCLSAWGIDHVRAGFGQVPPLHFADSHGNAAGFIVDAVNEAARREQVQVTWQQVGGSQDIEPALGEKRIDLFPAAIINQSRSARFWISEPWWTEDLSILARADLGDVRSVDWRGEKLLLPSKVYYSIASAITPGATFEILTPAQSRAGSGSGISLICSGKADAALMSHSTVDEVLAKRPENCLKTDFRILETSTSLPLAMISRWDHRQVAERIRSRINEMALDGTLIRIVGQYPRTPARSAIMLAETLRLRYNQRLLWAGFVGTLLIAVLAILLLTRQLAIQGRLRSTMAQQVETELTLRTRTNELMLSNEELQAFAYSVSHDLQEPVRTIGLYAQMLERHFPFLQDEAKHHLDLIRGNALRMQEMLQQLLLLSRVSRSEVRRVLVPLQDVLCTVMEDLKGAIDLSSGEVVIGPMPVVQGWPDRLSVVFQNLIGNALKYRKDGTPVRVEICAMDQGSQWMLTVADNGIGFEQKYAEQIFGVFRRLHVRDQYGGTGVGLAIVKRVVERHGGRIWAESEPDRGSTFYFTLPKEC